jgi:hypothetical protein
MKAAKLLRRGKRISEIEVRYGKNAVELATGTASAPIEAKVKSSIPELTPEFFESAFFRRFQVQSEPSIRSLLILLGPILDPADFVGRYLSFSEPCAANLGPEGALLCHVLYAWATSYGVDELGQLDIPDGGGEPLTGISLLEPGLAEVKREQDRQTRFNKMRSAVEVILDEIDACGILRKPTWDGVRVLLLLLPLTEGESCNDTVADFRHLITCRAIGHVRKCIVPSVYAMLSRRPWLRWQSSRDFWGQWWL